MANKGSLVLTVSFEPIKGKEHEVKSLLINELTGLAYSRGASWVGTKLEEDRFVTTAHFLDDDSLELYVSSVEHDKLIKQITSCCNLVIMEDVYET